MMRVNVTYEFEDDDLALLKRRYQQKDLSRDDLKRFMQVAIDSVLNEWYEQDGTLAQQGD